MGFFADLKEDINNMENTNGQQGNIEHAGQQDTTTDGSAVGISNFSYDNLRHTLKTELNSVANSFVKIGYLLKEARDTDVLAGSGYANVNDFAKAEFGLEKSQVSRFISINERFANPDNPYVLSDKYQGFGHSKLSVMLLLPDSINEELSPDYTRNELTAIKDEVLEAKETTGIELLLEENHGYKDKALLYAVVHHLFENETGLFKHSFNIIKDVAFIHQERHIKEAFAPMGEQSYTTRIPGIPGKILMMFKNNSEITILNMSTDKKELFFIADLVNYLRENHFSLQPVEEFYQTVYGHPFPTPVKEENAGVAPVQPPASKVVKSTPPDKTPKQAPEPPANPATAKMDTDFGGEEPENPPDDDETPAGNPENPATAKIDANLDGEAIEAEIVDEPKKPIVGYFESEVLFHINGQADENVDVNIPLYPENYKLVIDDVVRAMITALENGIEVHICIETTVPGEDED